MCEKERQPEQERKSGGDRMIRKKDVRRMAAILCVMTGMTGIPAYAAVPETLGAKAGWNQISGNWYYLMGNGAWSTDFIEDENTCYTFTKDGIFSYARKNPNTRGGAYPVYMLDQKEQELFDEMNDEKSDLFFDAYPDAEDDYDNGDVEFYDGQASFVLDQTLNEIAEKRLSLATYFRRERVRHFLRCTSGDRRRRTIRMILS